MSEGFVACGSIASVSGAGSHHAKDEEVRQSGIDENSAAQKLTSDFNYRPQLFIPDPFCLARFAWLKQNIALHLLWNGNQFF